MRIIPAIDILHGKCVRLEKGDYATERMYHSNPVEVAKAFEASGIQYLHLVDLDGAKSGHIVNHRILNEIVTHTKLKVDFGGGLRSISDVNIAFENGATQITGGSAAVRDPKLFLSWLSEYGAEKVILGADARDRKIATEGWREVSETNVIDFINDYVSHGIHYVICTDIAKDGMMQGTSNALYSEILDRTDVRLIASGGVSSIDDLISLRDIGCEGAIVGKAIYEQRITLEQLSALC